MGTMDGIIDTVSANHSIQPLIGLLKTSGKLILVGAPPLPLEILAMPLLLGKSPLNSLFTALIFIQLTREKIQIEKFPF